jgi:hypothetical protein
LQHVARQQLQQQTAISWSCLGQWLNSQQQPLVRLHDVAMLMYALAKLQYRPSRQFLTAANHAAATACWQLLLRNKQRKQQQQQQHQGQFFLQYDAPSAPSAAGAAAQSRPPSHVRVQDISLLLWAMGKLHHKPPHTLLRLLYKAAVVRLHAANASDVGLMLWGLARVRARPRHEWLQQVLSHFLARLDDSVAAAPAVCNVVYALPHLPGGDNLNQMLVAKLAEGQQPQQLAGAARVRFGECGVCELVALLQGFAGLGFSPGAGWLAEHQQRCEQLGREGFTEREQQLMAQARAVLVQLQQQQQQVAGTEAQRMLRQQQQQLTRMHGRPRLASAVKEGCRPEQPLWAAVLATLV